MVNGNFPDLKRLSDRKIFTLQVLFKKDKNGQKVNVTTGRAKITVGKLSRESFKP